VSVIKGQLAAKRNFSVNTGMAPRCGRRGWTSPTLGWTNIDFQIIFKANSPIFRPESKIYLGRLFIHYWLFWNYLFFWTSIASLVAASNGLTLGETQPVEIYTGPLVAGRWNGFFGYRLADGTIVFNGRQSLSLVSQ